METRVPHCSANFSFFFWWHRYVSSCLSSSSIVGGEIHFRFYFFECPSSFSLLLLLCKKPHIGRPASRLESFWRKCYAGGEAHKILIDGYTQPPKNSCWHFVAEGELFSWLYSISDRRYKEKTAVNVLANAQPFRITTRKGVVAISVDKKTKMDLFVILTPFLRWTSIFLAHRLPSAFLWSLMIHWGFFFGSFTVRLFEKGKKYISAGLTVYYCARGGNAARTRYIIE